MRTIHTTTLGPIAAETRQALAGIEDVGKVWAMIARATAAVAATVVLSFAGLSSAAASVRIPDDGQEPGSGISAFAALALFVGIPLLIIITLTALVYLPSMRSPKTPYEPSTDVATRQ